MTGVNYPGLILLVGSFAVLGVTARIWDTRPRLHGLPIAYGIVAGMVTEYSKGGFDVGQMLEGVGSGIFIGLLSIFVIWIERRS